MLHKHTGVPDERLLQNETKVAVLKEGSGLGQGLHGNMVGAGLERKMASPVIRDSTPL